MGQTGKDTTRRDQEGTHVDLVRPVSGRRRAQDLYDWRVERITPETQASARELGCRFHCAWYAADGARFYAIANWDTREGASAFFQEWDIRDEPGEEAFVLEGDIGLVPLP
jgi:hypothetical protein